VHDESPSSEKLPAVHIKQSKLPLFSENVPFEHFTATLEPWVDTNFPGCAKIQAAVELAPLNS